MEERFDVAIVGAGPAGLSAAVNAASEGLSVVVLDSAKKVGGQSRYSAAIENYLGFPKITGQQLANRAAKQALKFGVVIRCGAKVVGIECQGPDKIVECVDGDCVGAKSVVIASGLKWRQLGASNEDRFMGHGVIYGGDKNMAQYYRGKNVVVVGGGNSAGQAALQWARFAESVKVLVRRPLGNTMSQYLIDRLEANPKVDVMIGSAVTGLEGSEKLEMCWFKAKDDVAVESCDAVLPFIGSVPSNDFAKGVCEIGDGGFIICPKPEVQGVFVAGDCREGSVKRIAAAVGEGSGVISQVHAYLSQRS